MGMNTAYDQCNTTEEIRQCLQGLTKDLLSAIPAPTRHPVQPLSAEVQIALDILPTLTYSDLKQHPHPVFALSEICRLLFKLGDHTALRQGLALSHTLYTFTCKRQESWRLSHLYKGIAQIGLHFTDLGIKNVLRGVVEHQHFAIMPVDQALGYWALTSAAILNRNLKLAASFAQRWYEIAQSGELAHEEVRARLGCQLVALLLDHESGRPKADAEWQALPPEWQPTGTFLLAWAASLSEPDASAEAYTQCRPADPYPLFLGVTWYASTEERIPATERFIDDFKTLCELRRTFCHPAAAANLTAEELERYATCLARWELPRPLYDFETLLKHKAVEHNFRCVMTRLLGKQVMERFISQPPAEPQILTQDEAIILVMDVRQYSALSEQRTPGEMFDLLNPLFKIITEEFERAGGAILEFIGDCIIIVFNTFQGQHSELSQILAHTVRCLQRIRVLNAMSLPTGAPEITLGVGINKGPVALGYLGGLERCHLTALGNTINLASRMESATKAFPADALLSARCFAKGEPNPWGKPLLTNYGLRELGQHTMRNITQPVHLFGVKPLLRYWTDFVPMGFVARAEPAVVYIDTGNAAEPGIIDHHCGQEHANSACELLNLRPDLLLEHLVDVPVCQIEFRLHQHPDLDCAATLYTAHELLDKAPRREILHKLAQYVSRIDQGIISQPEYLRDSLMGIFTAHQSVASDHYGREYTDWQLLEAGLRVIDAAVYVMEQSGIEGDLASIFQAQPSWFPDERRLLDDDLTRYREDLHLRSQTYIARVNGLDSPVRGLWLDHPQSVFFKLWARNDPNAPGGQGYPFLAVDWSSSDKQRFVISVDPESGTNLRGLGQVLEQYESRKRAALGQERPVQPIRYPADNSDPWYFGQGHQYTIIDSPWEGTVLTAAEVRRIHETW